MTMRVLLVSSKPVTESTFAQTVPQLQELGASVSLATRRDPGDALAGIDGLEVHVLAKPTNHLERAVTRRLMSRSKAPMKTWLLARQDAWVRDRTTSATMLVSLDNHANYTVWHLAKRNKSAAAVFGLHEALRRARETAN